MRWKWKLGRLAGIDIYLHWTLALMLGWSGLAWTSQGAGALGILLGLFCSLSVFSLVTFHELGHALAARRFGIGTRDITLLPVGGLARLERLPGSPGQEMVVALAGPAVNLVLAGLITLALQLSLPWWWLGLGHFLVQVNLALALFNLLPAFPMDGGRVLRAALALQTRSLLAATRSAVTVSRGVSFLMGLYGLVSGQPWLVIIAAYIWMAGTFELAQVRAGGGGLFGGLDKGTGAWALGAVRAGRGPVLFWVSRR